MSLWEYKQITGGSRGFATPALLETFLNNLGKEEWEIIHYQTRPDNPLAFEALAKRPTSREWTLENAISDAAAAQAEKLRAEFEAKFKNLSNNSNNGNSTHPDGTSSDLAEPETEPTHETDTGSSSDTADWDNLDSLDDDLPTLFDALKPQLRLTRIGHINAQSVSLEHLCKTWETTLPELTTALQECGFQIPATTDDAPQYLEFEGDLYWLNLNPRGQLYINTREKPRPAFRITQAQPLNPDDPATQQLAEEHAAHLAKKSQQQQTPAPSPTEQTTATPPTTDPSAPPPAEPFALTGISLLTRLRPIMRPNQGKPGASGNVHFLAKALKTPEKSLIAALAQTGIPAPQHHKDKPTFLELESNLYWLNKDHRRNLWLNTRPVQQQQPATPATPPAPAGTSTEQPTLFEQSQKPTPAPSPAETATPPPASEKLSDSDAAEALDAIREHLSANKRGTGTSAPIARLAEELEITEQTLLETLASIGIPTPSADPDAKPVFHTHNNEIFWLAPYSKTKALWLNAKPSKSKSTAKKPSPKKSK